MLDISCSLYLGVNYVIKKEKSVYCSSMISRECTCSNH